MLILHKHVILKGVLFSTVAQLLSMFTQFSRLRLWLEQSFEGLAKRRMQAKCILINILQQIDVYTEQQLVNPYGGKGKRSQRREQSKATLFQQFQVR